jgi:ABC-type sugar transport system substrate-binding protein
VGKPLPLITFGPFEASAREMVQTARLVAKDRGIPDDAPAQIVVHKPYDDHTAQRVEAMKGALKEAGIPLLAVLEFDRYPGDASAALSRVAKAVPNLGYVLVDEDQGITGCSGMTREEYDPDRPPVVVGYLRDPKSRMQVKLGECAALADRRVQLLAIKAVQAAVELAQGKSVPERVEVQPEVIRGSDPVAISKEAVRQNKIRRQRGVGGGPPPGK